MKNLISLIGLSAASLAVGFQAFAVPARPGLRTVTMNDGTELRVRLVGDEFYHQYFTEDGFPLVQKDGIFYYSDFTADGREVNSGIRACGPESRSAEALAFVSKIDKAGLESRMAKRAAKAPRRLKYEEVMSANETFRTDAPAKSASLSEKPLYERGYGLFPGTPFPAYGHQRGLVILVEYQDVKFADTYDVDAKDYFTRMLNEEGFSDLGGTGSAADYFKLNSGNTFIPQFDVYGPITLSQNQAYYGANDYYGDDLRPHMMIKEACDQLDDIIDFGEYDRNNDGLVDNVFVFYAGTGEASSGKSDDVWPHSWTMTAAGLSKSELMYDGKQLENYTCSNEWMLAVDDYGRPVAGDPGRPDGVGTFIHEFSHTMGLPDLYATTYTSSFTPGTWSVLDYGPYNNNGCTPPLYSAFERYALGWIKPRVVKEAVSAKMPPISDNFCAIIPTSTDTEFFLLENRQQEGWDKFIPGHGMLVWHIDYQSTIWRRNAVNNTPSHQYVDLLEADNRMTESSRAGDAFPGTSNKTEFHANTLPALKTWSNAAIDLPITNIAEEDGIIYFDVLGGNAENDAPILPAENVEHKNVAGDSFTIAWEPREGCEAVVNVFLMPEQGDGPENGDSEGEGRNDILAKAGDAVSQGEKVFVTGFFNRNVGNVSEILVDGLEPDTRYGYTVTMINDLKESETVVGEPVVTSTQAGVQFAADDVRDYLAVRVEGRTVSVASGMELTVTDLTGAIVARGKGRVTVSAPGLYVVSVPGSAKAAKIVIR